MEFYYDIVHDPEPVMTLVLPRKTGKVPKGTYQFLEYYCTDPGCDCRRVTVVVLNEKQKQKAMISFGFDQQGPFGGPYLDASSRQSPYAEDLLNIFVQSLNSGPDWLDRLHRHYAAVRERVEGKPYHGKAFPKPGELVYHATPPPDLAAEIEQSLRNLQARGGELRPSTAGKGLATPAPSRPKPQPSEGPAATIETFVSRYVEAGNLWPAANLMQLANDLRLYLMNNAGAGGELAALLPALYQQSPQPDEQIQGALRLLFDALSLLDDEIESGRAYARQRMADLQKALGRHVFSGNEDVDLCAAVTNVLVQSRVEILPVLGRGGKGLIFSCAPRSDLSEAPPEEILTGIARSFHSIGVTSPYEGAEELLKLFDLTEAQMQAALTGEMLAGEEPLLREAAALMLFHPEPEVRLPVSRLLASLEGKSLTPEILLRLIISRNWFTEELRKNVDQAITNARKRRVECAPMPNVASATVFASSVDPGGEQAFEVVVPDALARCRIVLKEGEGIVDCAVAQLKSKYDVEEVLKMLRRNPLFLLSSAEHLDLRVCNALSDGGRLGKVPNLWLVRVAELLGRDRWRMIPLESARELLFLEEELEAQDPKLLEQREFRDAVDLSGDLISTATFLSGWRETDPAVEREVMASPGRKGKGIDVDAAVEKILGVMEKRRNFWLERLVITALWLDSSEKAPVKWHRVYHVAQAVADETIPFNEIPLMVSIAETTLRFHIASTGRSPD